MVVLTIVTSNKYKPPIIHNESYISVFVQNYNFIICILLHRVLLMIIAIATNRERTKIKKNIIKMNHSATNKNVNL